ncbi:MAG: HDIG domain-containing protein [Thermodesulfovibrionales bacterium]
MPTAKDNLPLINISMNRAAFLAGVSLVISLLFMSEFSVSRIFGGMLLSFVLLFIFQRDIMRYKPSYMQNYQSLLLLTVLIVGTVVIGRLFGYFFETFLRGFGLAETGAAVYGIPIAAGAMLVTLLFDFHTAITFSFTISLLTGFWLENAFYPIYAFVGSLTAAFGVIRCKKRSALLKAGFSVVLVNVAMVLIIMIAEGALLSPAAVTSVLFAVFSGVAVSSIVSLVLPLLEYIFKVSTDISLLELLDLNQPLMKMLMISAPGTYHHSVIVGNLVESAAEAVGVNPLLARVSSYYHDIGKIKMPDYFVENQGGAPNRHNRLTPHMSTMIIVNHVKEGVELAKQHKLPESIIDSIRQHHGSMLITYFYQKAKEHDLEAVPSEDEYRYPGPKPQTRVAALVMMADAVEAASKVLNDPTPARIASLVERIINHIFLEGQLDECELTLKDISEIKKRFIYILTGILHKRIDYPGFDFNDGHQHTEPAAGEKIKPAQHPA